MGRNSRIRKNTSNTSNLQINIKKSPRESLRKQIDPFWDKIAREFAKLSFRYPYLQAERPNIGEHAGQWIIVNQADRGEKSGERAFRDLATLAAQKLGCHGGPEECVHFWISHCFGDHVQSAPVQVTNFNKVDFFTQYGDGSREMHLGRYKQSGVDHYTSPDSKKPIAPMAIPSPVVQTEPLIKLASK